MTSTPAAGHQDRVNLQGTELRPRTRRLAGHPHPGTNPAERAPTVVLQRCETEGLRVLRPQGEELILAAAVDLEAASLDLATGRVRVRLTTAGKKRLGTRAGELSGQGFDLASTIEELAERHATGSRRLHLSAVGLRPANQPDDALLVLVEHFSAEGITFHLPQAADSFVPWSEIESATLDLLSFRLRITFRPEALARNAWLSGFASFESSVREA